MALEGRFSIYVAVLSVHIRRLSISDAVFSIHISTVFICVCRTSARRTMENYIVAVGGKGARVRAGEVIAPFTRFKAAVSQTLCLFIVPGNKSNGCK